MNYRSKMGKCSHKPFGLGLYCGSSGSLKSAAFVRGRPLLNVHHKDSTGLLSAGANAPVRVTRAGELWSLLTGSLLVELHLLK